MRKANNFSNSKISTSGCFKLSVCLIFYQFQPGVTYKSVVYKKESIFKTANTKTLIKAILESIYKLLQTPGKTTTLKQSIHFVIYFLL